MEFRLLKSVCRLPAVIGVLTLGLVAVSTADLGQLLVLAKSRYDARGVENVRQWQAVINGHNQVSEREKLVAVNDFFNRHIRFADDLQIWQQRDYWATPLETLGTRQGDCEDFSIAKYVSLLKMNVPASKLRLTYVKAMMANGTSLAHMVLAYYPSPNTEPLILDNLSKEILPASRRSDLKPVFSFNSAGLWVAGKQQPASRKPETRLSRWRSVLLRMQAEGI